MDKLFNNENQALALRAAFFNEASDQFTLLDKDLNIIEVNDSALRLLHLKRESILGKNIAEISPDVISSGRYELYREVIRTGTPHIFDKIVPHPSFGNISLRLKAFKVGDGMGIISTDFTDLNNAVQELETFIYKLSHDLRSPMSSILGVVNLTKNDMDDFPAARKYFDIIRDEVVRMDTIREKLLETMRIRQGEKILHQIDFNAVIDSAIRSLTPVKGFRDVVLQKSITVQKKFYSDKNLLLAVFQNLIDNAIKYRKEEIRDPYININVGDEAEGIKITVNDNGIGIAENLQADVFKLFFRATNKSSGCGIGLYTVNHCVKKLGGSISLQSKENSGTTFTVLLPTEKIDENAVVTV